MKANAILGWGFIVSLVVSCGDEPSHQLTSSPSPETRAIDIMPAEQAATYKALLPQVDDPELARVLTSADTMWYDASSIVPGYQDSMGDPEGMRPNTITSEFIDLAVPGGHGRLFKSRGLFHFPFATGGLDESPNAFKINFWSAPKSGNGFHPVVYWRLNWSRWRWLFPKGTIIGEVLFVKFPDNDMRVFEIRTRTRHLTEWVVDVFRPFPTAESYATAIKSERPEWESNTNLRTVVQHLTQSATMQPYQLSSRYFGKAFQPVKGHLDFIPEVTDTELTKQLLRDTTFTSARDQTWKSSGTNVTYAASSKSRSAIVPQNYQAGVFPVNDEFCSRCHVDAGRQISHFHPDLVLYGELWGEDQTFSWHPFKTESFVNRQGRPVSFNNENRRLRDDFVNAGLVTRYNPSIHSANIYKELPKNWKYEPL